MVAPNRLQTSLGLEPGSFRDWDSRVFVSRDSVARALTEDGLADWEALAASDLFGRFTASGELVSTTPAAARRRWTSSSGSTRPEAGSRRSLTSACPSCRIRTSGRSPCSRTRRYCSCGSCTAALAEGLMLKDATPYNVQWRGSQPVFVDIGSFERGRDGESWAGYRQFCTLFLYPLLLEAYRGVPFQPWLRGSIDGISPVDFRALFTRRDAFRRGMLRHVFLHASLERRYAGRGKEVRDDLQEAGFDSRLVETNVAGLTKLVSRLHSPAAASGWTDYRSTCSYDDAESGQKEQFVRRAVESRRRGLVWDLGCNDGRYSRIASDGADLVVAVDSDRHVVDALYATLKAEGNRKILPLVVDLTNPSPAIGWSNTERATFVDRGAPELVLALALVHHLSISGNVPLREVVEWLRGVDGEVVIEFPDRSDPMVQRLLGAKRENAHPDYSRETFEALLRARFRIVNSLELASGTRTLYHVVPS